MAGNQLPVGAGAPEQVGIVRLKTQRKGNVVERVFMRTVDLCGARQSGHALQRCIHLLRRPLENPAAAATKQCITAEQMPWSMVG